RGDAIKITSNAASGTLQQGQVRLVDQNGDGAHDLVLSEQNNVRDVLLAGADLRFDKLHVAPSHSNPITDDLNLYFGDVVSVDFAALLDGGYGDKTYSINAPAEEAGWISIDADGMIEIAPTASHEPSNANHSFVVTAADDSGSVVRTVNISYSELYITSPVLDGVTDIVLTDYVAAVNIANVTTDNPDVLVTGQGQATGLDFSNVTLSTSESIITTTIERTGASDIVAQFTLVDASPIEITADTAAAGTEIVLSGAGDVNGDGIADTISLSQDGTFATLVYEGATDSADVEVRITTAGGSTPLAVYSGVDMNRDGFDDVLVATDENLYVVWGDNVTTLGTAIGNDPQNRLLNVDEDLTIFEGRVFSFNNYTASNNALTVTAWKDATDNYVDIAVGANNTYVIDGRTLAEGNDYERLQLAAATTENALVALSHDQDNSLYGSTVVDLDALFNGTNLTYAITDDLASNDVFTYTSGDSSVTLSSAQVPAEGAVVTITATDADNNVAQLHVRVARALEASSIADQEYLIDPSVTDGTLDVSTLFRGGSGVVNYELVGTYANGIVFDALTNLITVTSSLYDGDFDSATSIVVKATDAEGATVQSTATAYFYAPFTVVADLSYEGLIFDLDDYVQGGKKDYSFVPAAGQTFYSVDADSNELAYFQQASNPAVEQITLSGTTAIANVQQASVAITAEDDDYGPTADLNLTFTLGFRAVTATLQLGNDGQGTIDIDFANDDKQFLNTNLAADEANPAFTVYGRFTDSNDVAKVVSFDLPLRATDGNANILTGSAIDPDDANVTNYFGYDALFDRNDLDAALSLLDVKSGTDVTLSLGFADTTLDVRVKNANSTERFSFVMEDAYGLRPDQDDDVIADAATIGALSQYGTFTVTSVATNNDGDVTWTISHPYPIDSASLNRADFALAFQGFESAAVVAAQGLDTTATVAVDANDDTIYHVTMTGAALQAALESAFSGQNIAAASGTVTLRFDQGAGIQTPNSGPNPLTTVPLSTGDIPVANGVVATPLALAAFGLNVQYEQSSDEVATFTVTYSLDGAASFGVLFGNGVADDLVAADFVLSSGVTFVDATQSADNSEIVATFSAASASFTGSTPSEFPHAAVSVDLSAAGKAKVVDDFGRTTKANNAITDAVLFESVLKLSHIDWAPQGPS
ncbi:MAG: hypothetical protein K0U36_06595, partial [Alphaproteobacteria bacterium]|nr:hypothetical protein [Alphaproteobacteria bacterium]